MYVRPGSVNGWSAGLLAAAVLWILVTGGGLSPLHAQEPEPTASAEAQEPGPESGEDAAEDGDETQDDGEDDEDDEDRELTDAERLLLSVEEPDPEDRLRFDISFTEEAGGGSGVALAEELELDGSLYVLIGRVEFEFQDIKIQAERAEIDQETKMVTALGNIVLDQGPTRLTGATMSFNLDDKTGSLTQARGYVSSDYYFSGEEILKTGERHYTVLDGSFSSCEAEVPAWSFRSKRTNVVIDGYARTRNTTLRVKKAPILYWPYLLWPVKPSRSSGLLVPKPGFSGTRGTTLGMAYYQAIGDSVDTTLYYEYSSEGFDSYGNQFRYQPTEGTYGIFEGNWIDDPRTQTKRWKASLAHESRDLPFGFRGAVVFEDASDFDYYRDFEREIRNSSRRSLSSYGFLTKNWGRQSLNIIVDQRETLLRSEKTVTLRQLPEIEYSMRATQLGNTPLYFGLNSAMHYFQNERADVFDITYSRFNIAPVLTLPVSLAPWMSLSIDASGIYTHWGDSAYLSGEAPEDAEGADAVFRGESLDRFLPSVAAEIVGPSVSRIYEGGRKWSKYKHIIEPRFAYVFVDEYDDTDRVIRFDEIDIIRGANIGRYGIINRLLAKPADEDEGGAREILSVELSRLVSFDDELPLQASSDFSMTSQSGPIDLELRFQPSEYTSLRQEIRYDTLFGGIASTSTSGTFGFGPHSIGLRWTTRMNTEFDNTRTNQFRLANEFQLVRDKLNYLSSVTFDANENFMQQQRHILEYTGNCYTMTLEFGEWGRLSRPEKENVIRFSVTLKNVGTFLDLTGGNHETL